ncbi:uncharacterized protein LOC123555967 [Mercenaria mercenaria]|uniref:uncharacterized protein LOC123555967 n=1 Tax=Mercenaria mercenaria TaxID=6596 RepID=UPI00234F2FF4|nr:uncharacterized protein LOC123555967 [Mercenaria mercenaria]
MSVEELDPEVLNDIFTNFFDQEEYGDFQVADRNFRQRLQNPKPMPLLTPREILYICTSCTARNDRTKCANLTAHSSLHQMINHRDAGSKKTPLGINKLYNIMRDMKAEAGIENPRITPYSSRKHLVQTLNDAGVPANQIMQISGHKNVNSINNYSKINNDQSRNISKILSNQRNETNLQTQGSGAASARSHGLGLSDPIALAVFLQAALSTDL